MIAIAADNGGVGRAEELNALKQQITALPKPARGDTKKAQEANAKGLEAIKAGQPELARQPFQLGFRSFFDVILDFIRLPWRVQHRFQLDGYHSLSELC
jgi:hypothetical protein